MCVCLGDEAWWLGRFFFGTVGVSVWTIVLARDNLYLTWQSGKSACVSSWTPLLPCPAVTVSAVGSVVPCPLVSWSTSTFSWLSMVSGFHRQHFDTCHLFYLLFKDTHSRETDTLSFLLFKVQDALQSAGAVQCIFPLSLLFYYRKYLEMCDILYICCGTHWI